MWRRDEPENRYNTPNRASNEPGNPKTNRCSTSNGVLVGERRGCDIDRLTLLSHPSGSEPPMGTLSRYSQLAGDVSEPGDPRRPGQPAIDGHAQSSGHYGGGGGPPLGEDVTISTAPGGLPCVNHPAGVSPT